MIATNWEDQFNKQEKIYGTSGHQLLHWLKDCDVEQITPLNDRFYIQARTRGDIGEFHAVLWAGGEQDEETRIYYDPNTSPRVPMYEGIRFWSDDQFDEVNCGLPFDISPRILISGGGDGALQDYLRIVTREKYVRDIYLKCNIPEDITNSLLSIEARGIRGRSWGRELACGDSGCIYSTELDFLHQKYVDIALARSAVEFGLESILHRVKTDDKVAGVHNPPDVADVQIVFSGDHPSAYYGLNRFLFRLLSTYIKRAFGVTTVFPGYRTCSVTNAFRDHDCMQWNSAKKEWEPGGGRAHPECHGKEHLVTFKSIDGAIKSSSDMKNDGINENFNVVIVRHGTSQNGSSALSNTLPPAFRLSNRLARPAHLLPLHFPHKAGNVAAGVETHH